MVTETLYICDGCNTTVRKGDKMTHDYMHLEGKLILELANKWGTFKEFMYITKAPAEKLTLCMLPGFPCLQKFIDRRRGESVFRKQQYLRDEAEREHQARRATELGM